MSVKIININPKYGDAVCFIAEDLPSAILDMAHTIVEAFKDDPEPPVLNDLIWRMREGIDYEVVPVEDDEVEFAGNLPSPVAGKNQ